jgi:hypothetical protein
VYVQGSRLCSSADEPQHRRWRRTAAESEWPPQFATDGAPQHFCVFDLVQELPLGVRVLTRRNIVDGAAPPHGEAGFGHLRDGAASINCACSTLVSGLRSSTLVQPCTPPVLGVANTGPRLRIRMRTRCCDIAHVSAKPAADEAVADPRPAI